MIRSTETTCPRAVISRARTHRCLGPPTPTGTPLTVTSIGPSTRTAITDTSLRNETSSSVAVPAIPPQAGVTLRTKRHPRSLWLGEANRALEVPQQHFETP